MGDLNEGTHQAGANAKSAVQPGVGEILRRKRKARGQRACNPCRQRKVKCDYETPCTTCVDRDHPELCLYQMPSKRVNVSSFAETLLPNSNDGRPSGTEWDRIHTKLDNIEQSLLELKNDLRHPAAGYRNAPAGGKLLLIDWAAKDQRSNVADTGVQGIHTNHDLTGETVHLGGNSVPVMVVAFSSDLWGLPYGSSSRIDELYKLLPNDADCLQYFRQYRDTTHVLYPVDRDSGAANINGEPPTEQSMYGTSLHWIGLLFAVLASGCQCSGIPRKERQLTSQVYVCCAYECLRTINYLAHSSLIDIQNLLILGNVISNNMNAGVAWSLLGLTIRLAQSLGLHRACPSSTPLADKILREEVWWRVIWQDSLLSITYDRASSTSIIRHYQPIRAIPSDGFSYSECMKSLCDIGLDIVQERSEPQDYQRELVFIIERRNELAAIMNQASHHLRDTAACKSMKDQLEHWNLYLHRSYVASELYRPTLKHSSPNSETITSLKATCVESLADTVEAFLGLENVTRFARQSWAAVHRALSSALLLGILKEPGKNQHVRTLFGRLITVMSDLSLALDPSEVSAPITRSISALRRLNPQEVERVASGHNPDESSPTSWKLHNFKLSPIATESSASTSSAPDRSIEASPYALVDKILWGTQHMSSI